MFWQIRTMPQHTFVCVVFWMVLQAASTVIVSEDRFACYSTRTNLFRAEPFESCPGLSAEWVSEDVEDVLVGRSFNVHYTLNVTDQFFPWAAKHNIFGMGVNLTLEECQKAACPEEPHVVEEDNSCCLHVNVHYCSRRADSPDTPCLPWFPPQGSSVHTASVRQTGNINQRHWNSTIFGLSHGSPVKLIAAFSVGSMVAVLERPVMVYERTDCGDDICGPFEDCVTCPADCGWCSAATRDIAITVSAVSVFLLMISALLVFLYFKKSRQFLKDDAWIVQVFDVVAGSPMLGKSLPTMGNASSQISLSFRSKPVVVASVSFVKGQKVAVKRYFNEDFQLTDVIRKEVKSVRSLDHPNLCKFIGGTVEPGCIFLLFEFCPKGGLLDIAENESIPLTWAFRFSLLTDVARGMGYLHRNHIVHGHLKSNNCVVDDRWTCKITGYGLPTYRQQRFDSEDMADLQQQEEEKRQLERAYKAPERDVSLTAACDVYSFAIIMVELASRERVIRPKECPVGWRPSLQRFAPVCMSYRFSLRDGKEGKCEKYEGLIQKCWVSAPAHRPTFAVIETALRRMNPNKRSAVDTMMDMMQSYSRNLETLVQERSKQLVEEKRRTDDLLYSILPRSVAESLKRGVSVSAEWFESSTVFFSDIVGFTALSARSTPLEVVAFLNKLYTAFDSIIERHDVYKVETIGDAYMVVSGVPERTEKHAYNVAVMSLEITAVSSAFTIPHLPDEFLKIKIGLGTGPVCAGVVGIKMPRYCLFGDTVNTASRMESTSLAYKIHISCPTYKELERYNRFLLEPRGKINVKGKGEMETWWLTGFTGQVRSSMVVSPSLLSPRSSEHDKTSQLSVSAKFPMTSLE